MPSRRRRERLRPRRSGVRDVFAREHLFLRCLLELQPDRRRRGCRWLGWWNSRRRNDRGRNGRLDGGRISRRLDGGRISWWLDGRRFDGRRISRRLDRRRSVGRRGGRLDVGWIRRWRLGWRERDLRGNAHRVQRHVRRPLREPRALRSLRRSLWPRRGLQPRRLPGAPARLHARAGLRRRLLLRPGHAPVHDGLPPRRRLSDGRDLLHGWNLSVPLGPARLRSAVCLRHRHHLVRQLVPGVPAARELDRDLHHGRLWLHLRVGLHPQRLGLRRHQ